MALPCQGPGLPSGDPLESCSESEDPGFDSEMVPLPDALAGGLPGTFGCGLDPSLELEFLHRRRRLAGPGRARPGRTSGGAGWTACVSN
jgi:hypothetical protein